MGSDNNGKWRNHFLIVNAMVLQAANNAPRNLPNDTSTKLYNNIDTMYCLRLTGKTLGRFIRETEEMLQNLKKI